MRDGSAEVIEKEDDASAGSGEATGIDTEQARRFLEALEPGGRFNFRTFADNGDDAPIVQPVGTFDDCRAKLERANDRGAGVFVVVNRGGNRDADIDRVRAVFVDLDDPEADVDAVRNCALSPHLIIESSPGKFHGYWLADDSVSVDEFASIQRAIAERFGGDRSVTNPSRVMRAPGFVHRKSDPFVSRIVDDRVDELDRYSRDEILAEFPPVADIGTARASRSNDEHDSVAAALHERDAVIRRRQDGGYDVRCPFEDEHTQPGGRGDCTYWPAHTGGYESAAFKCFHNACADRGIRELREALGIDSRPVIPVRGGQLVATVHAAIAALSGSGIGIYDRGGQLVRERTLATAEHDADNDVRRPAGATVIEPVGKSWIRLRLAEHARWVRWRAREKDWAPIDPPAEIAGAIVETPDEHDWPTLRAVVRHPVQWLDGSWSADGYAAGLLIDAPGEWPEPGDTHAEGEAALRKLRDVLRHMPWGSETDEAVGLSMVVTAVHRPVLDTAPLHAADAPTAGSGKSLLADTAAILATGAPAAVMDWGNDPNEAAKRLDAMQLAGDPVITLDNVEAPLEGAALCQALTQTTRRIRPLGESKVLTVPSVAMMTATGNNLVIKGDLVRRTLVCRLDPATERPETRSIDQDLLAEVHERRAELVAAAQTIVRAYVAAGSPDQGLQPLGSFRQWSETVRAALVWAGMADPVETVERTRADDPVREQTETVLAAWWRAFGDQPATAADAVDAALRADWLHEAIAPVATRRGDLDPQALSFWLRGRRDVRVGGYVLRRGSRTSSGYKWIVSVPGCADSAHSADVPSPTRGSVSGIPEY